MPFPVPAMLSVAMLPFVFDRSFNILGGNIASTMAGELAIILNGTVPGGVNVFRTLTVLDPAGGGWTRATGLTAGLTDGRGIIPGFNQGEFRAFFADRDAWETTDGVAYTERNEILPVGESPNHVLWLGQYTGFDAALIAGQAAIYEWPIGEATADELRPATGFATWPASAVGRGLAIGAAVASSALGDDRIAALGVDASPREISTKIGGAGWTTPVGVTGITSSDPQIVCVNSMLWFAINAVWNDAEGSAWGVGARTQEGGATWDAIPGAAGEGTIHIARDAGGRLWRTTQSGGTNTVTKIYYSDDDGDNWTLVKTWNGASQNRLALIACHPLNPSIIAVFGYDYVGGWRGVISHSANAQSATPTFTDHANTTTIGPATGIQYETAYKLQFAPSGRLFVIGQFQAEHRIVSSDDYGATLTTRFAGSAATGLIQGLFISQDGQRVAVAWEPDTAVSPDVIQIQLSSDAGASFAALALAQSLRDFVGADCNIVRFAGSPQADAIYIATDTTKDVIKLSPVNATGVWTDLSAGYPHASQGRHNLAVIP